MLPRLTRKALLGIFMTMLEHAEKWRDLRKEFNIGILALVPRGVNAWFGGLLFRDLPIYLRLIAAISPIRVNMAGDD
jgi:hypothetical protein